MKLLHSRFLSVLLLLLPSLVLAQNFQLKESVLRAHLSYLADDLLEGRGTGQRGGDLAARYLATQAQIIGLQSLSSDPTLPYLHRVSILGSRNLNTSSIQFDSADGQFTP